MRTCGLHRATSSLRRQDDTTIPALLAPRALSSARNSAFGDSFQTDRRPDTPERLVRSDLSTASHSTGQRRSTKALMST